MRSIDSARLCDSYFALLPGITPEKRKALWVAGRELFPAVADHLWNHYASIEDTPENQPAHDKIAGAMVMFLTLVNTVMDRPVLGLRSSSATGGLSLPSFGNLPGLHR